MRHDGGYSLIESLTALAVFAVGATCHATWAAQSMMTHARASRLVAATTIAVSLEIRMRANAQGVLAGHYESDARRLSCASGCDAREIAAADLWLFHRAIGRHLGGAASSRVSCWNGSACTISIFWLDRSVLEWSFHP
jgi:prepilin-type N-terminal cleavage/methylation domain-containing protein